MVGKSSLFLRFTKNDFIPIDKNARTINAVCDTKSITVDRQTIGLNIWVILKYIKQSRTLLVRRNFMLSLLYFTEMLTGHY